MFSETSCFLYDPNVCNLISGLLWLFQIHLVHLEVLQFKYCWSLSLRDFEHSLTSIWYEYNNTVVWIFLSFTFWIEIKTHLFPPSPLATAEFSKLAHVECSTLAALSFSISYSSAGIPLSLLSSFAIMLPEATATYSQDVWIQVSYLQHLGYLGHYLVDVFFCVFLLTLFNLFCFC